MINAALGLITFMPILTRVTVNKYIYDLQSIFNLLLENLSVHNYRSSYLDCLYDKSLKRRTELAYESPVFICYLFISGFFEGSISSSDCVVSNIRVLMNNDV